MRLSRIRRIKQIDGGVIHRGRRRRGTAVVSTIASAINISEGTAFLLQALTYNDKY